MTIKYVTVLNGAITGEYANPQPQLAGYQQIDDTDPIYTLWIAKNAQLAALDNYAQPFCDLFGLIRAGNATNVTGAGIGGFLATVNNNYRSKRTAIATALTAAAANAVDVTAGWPPNP
jgi:hypothetical protein